MMPQVHCNSHLSGGTLRWALGHATHSLVAVISAGAAETCFQLHQLYVWVEELAFRTERSQQVAEQCDLLLEITAELLSYLDMISASQAATSLA